MPVVGAEEWPAQQARYWAATHALRQAEELAKLAPTVSGPADTAPKNPAEAPGFIADWAARAKAALRRAYEWRLAKQQALQQRGAEVARRIREGARRIAEASPTEAAKEGIADIARHAGGIAAWTFVGQGIGLLLVAWLAYEFLFKGKG